MARYPHQQQPVTSNSRLLQLLMKNRRSKNTGTTTGGLAHALDEAMMGYIAGEAARKEQKNIEDRQQVNQAAIGALNGEQIAWNSRRPDGSGDMVTQAPPNVSRAAQLFAGSNDPNQQAMGMRLAMDEQARKRAAAALAEQRAYTEGRDKVKNNWAMNLAQMKYSGGTNAQKDYDRAVKGGFKGTFFQFLQAKAMATQGVIFNPGGKPGGNPSLTIMPGGRSDIMQKNTAARLHSNSLGERRLKESIRKSTPAYIKAAKTAEREAALAMKRKEALPGKQSQIITMVNTTEMFDAAIKDAIKLGHSSVMGIGVTGGNVGTIAGLSKSSDQAKLERKLLTIKGIVGLDELIGRKEQGGTFGALSDTEMALLQASLGAFSGDMEGPELEAALSEVKRLHTLNVAEKIRNYGEIYPNEKRPWESPKKNNTDRRATPRPSADTPLSPAEKNELKARREAKRLGVPYKGAP